MSIVKAFVGHSFTEDDKTLNNTFLDYLDQIKLMGIGFTWDHAKAAEPRELAKKVMSLIQGKNLFVGICTKKERVIGPNELERCWLRRNVVGGYENKFFWKTSDWLIQEIGLAIGREMDLILLIEEGLRPPGGLQGDIEYIEFSRQYPERSFGKILEMIRALIPKVVNAPIQELETTSPESTAQEQLKKGSENWWHDPKSEWSNNRYRIALRRSINDDNPEVEKKITEAFLKTPEGRDQGGPVSWEVYGQYYRLFLGKGGSLNEIERMAKEEPKIEKVHSYLGRAYEIYKEYIKAGKEYEHASEQAANSNDKLEDLGAAAIAYCHGGMKLKSEESATKMRQEVFQSGVGEETLVTTLIEIANIESDMASYYGLSERMLELKPGYTHIRFNLAYKYSQGKEQNLSLFHYLRIPEPERHGVIWNNLGAQYDHFQMVGSSVRCYRKSEQVGETLAMSNIAYKFINVGFLPEAEDICINAIKSKNYHNNINHAMARIKEIPDEEAKKEEDIVKESVHYSDFYKAYGKALCKTNPSDHIGIWEGLNCQLRLEIHGNRFMAEGTYETPKNRLLAAYSALGVGAQSAPPGRRNVKYVGKLSGYSIEAEMIEEEDNKKVGSTTEKLLSALADRTKRTVLMVISDLFNEIWVYDNDDEPHRFYTLRKLRDGE